MNLATDDVTRAMYASLLTDLQGRLDGTDGSLGLSPTAEEGAGVPAAGAAAEQADEVLPEPPVPGATSSEPREEEPSTDPRSGAPDAEAAREADGAPAGAQQLGADRTGVAPKVEAGVPGGDSSAPVGVTAGRDVPDEPETVPVAAAMAVPTLTPSSGPLAAPPVDRTHAEAAPEPMPEDLPDHWEDGDPPLAVELVRQGRLGEAYWVTKLSSAPAHRVDALRFAAAAFDGIPDIKFPVDELALHDDPSATAVVLTAALRAGLANGWWHTPPSRLRNHIVLAGPWERFIDATIAAVQQGYRIEPAGMLQEIAAVGFDDERAELGARAMRLLKELPQRKIQYQRATRVLQRLSEPGQPLAAALEVVSAWACGTAARDALAGAAATLANGAVDAMIARADAAVSSPHQARERIVAGASRALNRAIDDVVRLVDEALAVAGRQRVCEPTDAEAAGRQLAQRLADVADEPVPGNMTGAALGLLRRWMTDPGTVTDRVVGYLAGQGGSDAPAEDVLLPLHDLPHIDGDVDRCRVTGVLDRLRWPLDIDAAMRAYCDRGDLGRAGRLAQLRQAGYWPFASSTTDLFAVLDRETKQWTDRFERRHATVSDTFVRLRIENLLPTGQQALFAGRLHALRPSAVTGLGAAHAALEALAEDLETARQDGLAELCSTLAAIELPDSTRAVITDLLDGGDVITASEFLSFVRAGQELPPPEAPVDDELPTFLALLDAGFAELDEDARMSARAWAERAARGRRLAAGAENGLTAWKELLETRDGLRGHRVRELTRRILRSLGLNPTQVTDDQEQRRFLRGYRQLTVTAAPADGSYVAGLGSAADEYIVTVVVDDRENNLLGMLPSAEVVRANVILCRRPLDLTARRQLATDAAENHVNAIVIDPAVMGWLSATGPNLWRATQRVTLPWTAFNPYTPFVAGLVPPEVFVGRDRELAEVAGPSGGLFVYGGRQLGKSALLRRVDATFSNGAPEQRYSVYLDLKGRGIGEAEPAARIWRELAIELKDRGVLHKVSESAGADVLVVEVRKWLRADPTRRILVLADEADAFLTADSRARDTAGGVSHFPNVLRLKELMESTERRFKVVFAGLHQVQRFVHLSNVPLVHGGPEIEIGPLDAADARRLVLRPISALGYRFERPELVWHLLSVSNYQASLIQILCNELVSVLHRKRGPATAYPVTVTAADVAAVVGNDSVRQKIAERLRITINLDDRYRVLMLIIAWHSIADGFSSSYTPHQLLDLALDCWSAGFADLTAAGVSIYLDEMVGLGLLIRLPGATSYAVRSPNVVNMLGSEDDVVAELNRTGFDLPYEYNPRDARTLLFHDEQGERRSPLTDGQLAMLAAERAVSVLVGSQALGVDRVQTALREYCGARQLDYRHERSGAEVSKALTALGHAAGRSRTVILADLRGRSVVEVLATRERLEQSRNPVTAIVIADPTAELAAAVEPVRLTRWTANSLRSWPECPYAVPDDRRRLIAVTGGWPRLVEEAIAGVVMRGATRETALAAVSGVADDALKAERLLTDAGLGDELRDALVPWLDYFDVGKWVSQADAVELLGPDPATAERRLAELGMLDLLDHVEAEQAPDRLMMGLVLDTVVHRCLRTTLGR
ncbi:MAG TPA: hypothetical protein VGD67_23005 [Pseudonocardiaceae bacterium]